MNNARCIQEIMNGIQRAELLLCYDPSDVVPVSEQLHEYRRRFYELHALTKKLGETFEELLENKY